LPDCPHLAAFPLLQIGRWSLNRGGLDALLSSPHLANVVGLDLTGNSIEDKGALALASANLPRLAELRLRDTEITPDGVQAIVSSASLGNLTHLNLSRSSFPKNSIAPALTAFRLPRLTVLSMGIWDVGINGAQTLAVAPWLAQLTVLNLN